jgi:hypothetical protein
VLNTVLGHLSDHCTLSVVVPWSCARVSEVAENPTTVYRWVDGSSLADYSHTWRAWNRHTDSPEFAAAFTAVLDTHVGDQDLLTSRVEFFFLEQALVCGVIKRQVRRAASNPNKRHKCLAPWFTEACRTAKKAYKLACKQSGRLSLPAKVASREFV